MLNVPHQTAHLETTDTAQPSTGLDSVRAALRQSFALDRSSEWQPSDRAMLRVVVRSAESTSTALDAILAYRGTR